MKIYAIYLDNGQYYEDYYYGIVKEHIYLDPFKAREECDKLNIKIPPETTEKEWTDLKLDYSFEKFKYYRHIHWLNREGLYTYSVVEHDVI